MLKTIKEVLRTGNATVKYPFAPIERPEYARGKPEHDSEKCLACSACAIVCPPNSIQTFVDINKKTITWSINYGRCVFCGRCQEVCPTDAIKLSKEFELAVMNKADLEEKCVYTLEACTECGQPFAPKKAVDYVARVLAASKADEQAQMAIDSISTCVNCKQKNDSYRFWEKSKEAGELLC
jgi:hydrogenase-4 component H